MSWFEEWFDSPLYEKIYASRNEREAKQLIHWMKDILPLEEYASILDLGCGRGRHTVNLALQGYRVTGLDLSDTSIENARELAKKRGVEDRVRFFIRDMRKPLSNRFDAILNLFTSFGYFKEDQENLKILDSVREMLNEEGKFILDYFNSRKVVEDYTPFERDEVEGIHYEIERFIQGEEIYKKIIFRGDELEDTVSYKERVKLYKRDWFEKQLEERGFEIDGVFGDYRGSTFNEEQSPRMIFVATRQK